MNLSQFAGAIAIASGLFSAGCLGTTDDLEAAALEAPGLTTLTEGAGTTGSNGLHPPHFHMNAAELYSITSNALVAPGPLVQNKPTPLYPNIHNNILSSPLFLSLGGSETFRYAVQCVVPSDKNLTHSLYGNYYGFGVLTSTSDWPIAGITDVTMKEDLFACMLAHLNPTSTTVPIRLTGAHVNNVSGDPETFTFQEALWIAKEVTPSTFSFRYVAWPLPDLKAICHESTSEWLEYRVCGQEPMDCNVHAGGKLEDDCIQGEDGNYTCLGQPAIKTWLETTGAGILYPSCVQ